MDDPVDPLVLVTAEIINVPDSRGLDEPMARTFFDNVALGGEQMLELFAQLGCSKYFPQVLDAETVEELRTRLAIDNADPSRIKYESETSVIVIVLVRPASMSELDAQAVALGRELAVVHLVRLIQQTGSADLRKEEVLRILKTRVFGNVSAFEQMCKLEPRTFRGVSWTDLFDR